MTLKITSPQALQCRSAASSTRSSRSRSARSASARSSPRTTCSRSTARCSASRRRPVPRTLWRYESLLPGGPGLERVDLGAGFTPLRRATNLAARLGLETLWIKDDSVNPSNSFKDRVVTIAITMARAFGFEAVSCASTGNLANATAAHAAKAGHGLLRVRSGRPGASEDPVDRGVRRQGRARRRELRRREPAVLRGRGGASLGVRQREHAPVLRGGFEVARVRDRGAARGGASRTTSWSRSRPGRC